MSTDTAIELLIALLVVKAVAVYRRVGVRVQISLTSRAELGYKLWQRFTPL
jgi:hypothetical protein